MLEAANAAMEAAKAHHEELQKLVGRKQTKLAELEQEQQQLREASAPGEDIANDAGKVGAILDKAQLADILLASTGEAAQGEQLDAAWARYAAAQEAKKQKEK